MPSRDKSTSKLPGAQRRPRAAAQGQAPRISELVGLGAIRVPWDTRIAVAWAMFIERALTAAPVVDRLGRPVGILYRGDLAAAVLDDEPTQPGQLPSRRPASPSYRPRPTAPAGRGAEGGQPSPMLAWDLMRPEVCTLPLSAGLDEARTRLHDSGAAELVVVNARGVMVGTISARDLQA